MLAIYFLEGYVAVLPWPALANGQLHEGGDF